MPTRFDTARELIFWDYAKLIARSATRSKEKFGFVQYCFRRLTRGEIDPSLILHENKKVVETGDHCAYRGGKHRLQWEPIIPRSLGGPEALTTSSAPAEAATSQRVVVTLTSGTGSNGRTKYPRSCLPNV